MAAQHSLIITCSTRQHLASPLMSGLKLILGTDETGLKMEWEIHEPYSSCAYKSYNSSNQSACSLSSCTGNID